MTFKVARTSHTRQSKLPEQMNTLNFTQWRTCCVYIERKKIITRFPFKSICYFIHSCCFLCLYKTETLSSPAISCVFFFCCWKKNNNIFGHRTKTENANIAMWQMKEITKTEEKKKLAPPNELSSPRIKKTMYGKYDDEVTVWSIPSGAQML